MADVQGFDYEGLFAKSAPEPGQRGEVKRARYDFAVAYPDPDSLQLQDLAESLTTALQEEGPDLAIYPHRQGYTPLRELVARRLAETRDIHVDADDLILGDGSGQAIQLLAEALLDPDDVVLTEDFVYSGTLATLRRFRTDTRGVACDEDGMLSDALEAAINTALSDGKRPKFIYTIPAFQNPQGWVMTLERRREMVRLSQRYDVPILEDDCYVDLRFDGEPVASIHSLDDTGRVMYVGSFSKIIAPGMRMGYVTAPPQVLDRAAAIKSGGGVNQFAALTVHRYATTYLEDHIADANEALRAKRDAMLAALGENFGSAATWSRPQGGLYVWLQMPEGTDLAKVEQTAFDAGVGYHAGNRYAPDGVAGANCARLCFGYNTPEEIREGINLLAQVFEREGLLGS